MQIDHYTKLVLTVIAVSLVWDVVRDLVSQRPLAQTGITNVRIVDQKEPIETRIVFFFDDPSVADLDRDRHVSSETPLPVTSQ
jgi:hypothetical protein